MPNVYMTGAYIPELKGHVYGAVTVVCHVPADLELVFAVADLAPRPPSSPLGSLAQTLSAPSIEWRDWWLHWRGGGGRLHPLAEPVKPTTNMVTAGIEEPESPLIEDSTIETFKQVLSTLYHIWTAQADDSLTLKCCISVAVASEDQSTLIEWKGSQPALAFGQGSLWASIGLTAWRARGFLAGLILGDGVDAASRRAGLVKKAREMAISKLRDANRQLAADLPDIRSLNQIPAGQDLCVLIHGLCSTDVGTFDQLEELIVIRSGKPGNANLAVVGFPHDSLTASIDTNAEELARKLVGLNARNLRFVCHSRGGLVARRTAAFLRQETKRPNWEPPPWIHSCVTFGTPHLGTSVASSPAELTACVMSLAHLSRSPSVAAVTDILCSVKAGSTWRSVSELRPIEDGYSCLQDLKKHEENVLFFDDALPLRVFGSSGLGNWRRRDWRMRFIERILGTADHDLLVPIASSVPVLRQEHPGARVIDRTHFEYFSRLSWEPPVPPLWNAALTALGLPNP
jgi:hypothetical protein